MATDQAKPLNTSLIQRGTAKPSDPDLALREKMLDEQFAAGRGVSPNMITQLREGGEPTPLSAPPVLVPVRKETPRKAFNVRLRAKTAAGVAAMAYYTGQSTQEIADEALEAKLDAWRSDWRNLVP